jgi:hypothetical protein
MIYFSSGSSSSSTTKINNNDTTIITTPASNSSSINTYFITLQRVDPLLANDHETNNEKTSVASQQISKYMQSLVDNALTNKYVSTKTIVVQH